MTSELFSEGPASGAPASFDVARLDRSTDAELDQLPFGIIALDAEGFVLRYNLYESRLARLDRNQVLGRSFFQEVAPCTRSADFEGRFLRYVAEGSQASERFEYLFDFKFGAQAVAVELVRPSNLDRYYLLINRTHFSAPRSGGRPAPLQSELAPGEALAGVQRDASERRIVHLPSTFFAGLKATCERLAPQTWPVFCHDWGVEWGRRAAIDLETHYLEADGRSLGELPMRRVAELLDSWFREQGLGRVTFDFSFSAQGCLVIELERSVIAEATSRPLQTGAQGSPPACALVAGCLSALLSHVGGRRLSAAEFACCAAGSARCSFLVVNQARKAALASLLESGSSDAASLVERLSASAGKA